MSQIRLVVQSELPNVVLMAMAVNKICSHYGMDEVEAFRVELCASEAATNAILHAYEGQPGHEVSLLVSVESDSMTLLCSDTGRSMGLEQIRRVMFGASGEDPKAPELREGGRGLEIIHEIMDEIVYTKDGGSNCLRMTKRFQTAGAMQA